MWCSELGNSFGKRPMSFGRHWRRGSADSGAGKPDRQLAAATQENRYADFLLRNSRNEALQKYRAAFDLASRYTFLAAKGL